MAPPTAAGSQRGLALLAVLIVVAAMGATLAATGTVWHEVQRREKEKELLFVGLQYRHAIARYYNVARSYPPNLDALVRDQRVPGVRRFLRRPYGDPMTNSTNWGLVLAPGGGVMGVYSTAKGRPIKQANFPLELGWPSGAESYADWQFAYMPPR